ncbi:MAG: penicillin-binding protein [Chloroflexaceae bacterium]|nr:penicillin-binding protein [Chloroflexaceae bacterium]
MGGIGATFRLLFFFLRRAAGFLWRLLLAFAQLALLGVLLLLLIGSWLYHHYGRNLPDPRTLEHHRTFETNRIYARDGHTLLYEMMDPQAGHRTRVDLDRIPRILQEATIAVEDANFYDHTGVDPVGIARALWLNFRHKGIVSGGSTITQQLVRATLLNPEDLRGDAPIQQRYERKIREAILAYRVSQEYRKDEILNFYLNEVAYGSQAYGAEAAARQYFNKHVWELTDGEATLLAGLPQSPTVLNPLTNLEGARERQQVTLGLMVKYGYLTPGRARDILAQPVTLVTPTTTIAAPHFAFFVRNLLKQRYPPLMLERGGLRVTTSLDPHWQAEAERIARDHIAALHPRNARNAAVVMLSAEGHVLAMVGSVDYHDPAIGGQVNVALAPRQPGSALKPIIYAAALQKGWTPATIIWDVPTSFERADGSVYQPQNYDHAWHGPQRMRLALANSLNIPAVRALEFVSIETFVDLAGRMGITTFDDPARYGLAMALGSNEVRLLELTAAYNTFRNGGNYQRPVAILSVEDNQGHVVEQPAPALEPQVLGPHGEQIAYLVTDMLSDTQARWPMFGRGNVMELPDGRPAAVKTGTSNDWRDSWAIGYTPDVTVGVWVGNNDNTPMHEVAGANGAALIWRDIMVAYHQDRIPQPFPRPDGVARHDICAGTGTLADPSCPAVIPEYFLEGTPPPASPVTYQTVAVGGDGTCLAAPYTPPDEVREVAFARYPAEFREWAARSGVPQPPTQPCPQPQDPARAVALLAPVSASGVVTRSQVLISGTARSPFILDVGQGASPQEWHLLRRGDRSVQEGVLGFWQSGAFDPGPYTLRLRVTMAEGGVVETRQTVHYAPQEHP